MNNNENFNNENNNENLSNVVSNENLSNSENVVVNVEESKNKNDGKAGLILGIVGILIIAVGIVLGLLFFNKEDKKTSKYFKEDTYFVYDDEDTGYFSYIIFDEDGKYNYSYVAEGKSGEAGSYEIKDDKIILNSEYNTGGGTPYKYKHKTEVDYSNKNKIVVTKESLKKIGESNFKNWHSDQHGYNIVTYNDVVKEFKSSSSNAYDILSNTTQSGYTNGPAETMINSKNIIEGLYGVRLKDSGTIKNGFCDFSSIGVSYSFENLSSSSPIFKSAYQDARESSLPLESLNGIKSAFLLGEGGCDSVAQHNLAIQYNNRILIYTDVEYYEGDESGGKPFVINVDKEYKMVYLYNYSYGSDDEAGNQAIDTYLILEDNSGEFYVVDKNQIINVKNVTNFNNIATFDKLTYDRLYN